MNVKSANDMKNLTIESTLRITVEGIVIQNCAPALDVLAFDDLSISLDLISRTSFAKKTN